MEFQISWKGYSGDPPPEVWTLDQFDEVNGFDKKEARKIGKLKVGEELVFAGPLDSVTVTRLS